MAEIGIAADALVDLTPDEDWRRLDTVNSKSKNAAYIVRPAVNGGVMVTLKNHSTGDSANWWSDSRSATTAMRTVHRIDGSSLMCSAPRIDYFSKTKELWDTLDDTSGAHSPYLQLKQVPCFRITRYSPKQRVTLIPIQDRYGKIVAIQRIPDPPDSSEKRIHGSGGLYCQIHGDLRYLALVEGFCTGGSVRLITGFSVAVCFSTAGMVKVAAELSLSTKALPEILIFADNDLKTSERIGKNPGHDAAKKAAAIIGGGGARARGRADRHARIFVPPMNGDWNDVHVHHGLEIAKSMFRNQCNVK